MLFVSILFLMETDCCIPRVCKTEWPLGGVKLQEKDKAKDQKHLRKLIKENPGTKNYLWMLLAQWILPWSNISQSQSISNRKWKYIIWTMHTDTASIYARLFIISAMKIFKLLHFKWNWKRHNKYSIKIL